MSLKERRRIVGLTHDGEPIAEYGTVGYFIDSEDTDVTRDPRLTSSGPRMSARQALQLAVRGTIILSSLNGTFDKIALSQCTLRDYAPELRDALAAHQAIAVKLRPGRHPKIMTFSGGEDSSSWAMGDAPLPWPLTTEWTTVRGEQRAEREARIVRAALALMSAHGIDIGPATAPEPWALDDVRTVLDAADA